MLRCCQHGLTNIADRLRCIADLKRLEKPGHPLLAVCSSQREDSCDQVSRFVTRATRLGMRAGTLPVDLSHLEVDRNLGLPGA